MKLLAGFALLLALGIAALNVAASAVAPSRVVVARAGDPSQW